MRYSFVDEAKIFVQSGNGGQGSGSFRRERCVEFGGPDGGNGGDGGDVIFIADDNVNTLVAYRYHKHFRAKSGECGRGRNMFGAKGNDIILKVPVGTEIYDSESEELMATLKEHGERNILIKGGQGGIGNVFFKSSVNQAPRKAMPGFEGCAKWIVLKMKLLANVGLLGKPNAGKSSFLRSTTNSKAKVANYQFTTLSPNLGVIDIDNNKYDGFVVADLPGLIEGAAQGKGLGIDFLKHVEKCEILLHIIDISNKNENQILQDYEMINNELNEYNELLKEKEEIIALNKIDICYDKEFLTKIKEKFYQKNKKVFLISTTTKEGLKDLILYLDSMIKKKKLEKSKLIEKKPYRPKTKYEK
jgi:GTP-binding protein